ncbi:Hypothetical protein PFR_JS4_1247 [Propionibacterium freudenreichii]|nr:Hypothetical protein PFR_JS4_1247 [Propionibacterium freudenreichii]
MSAGQPDATGSDAGQPHTHGRDSGRPRHQQASRHAM